MNRDIVYTWQKNETGNTKKTYQRKSYEVNNMSGSHMLSGNVIYSELLLVQSFRSPALGRASRRGGSRPPDPPIDGAVASQGRVPLHPARGGKGEGALRR